MNERNVVRGGLFLLRDGDESPIQVVGNAPALIADNMIARRPRWWQLRSWFQIVRWVFR